MARVLVLGAGFGGVPAALALDAHLPDGDEVVLADRRAEFCFGLTKLWAMDLDRRPVWRPLGALQADRVDLRVGTVEAIEPASPDEGRGEVVVDGDPLAYDRLVVALGAAPDPGGVPGFRHVPDVYRPAGAARFARELRGIDEGRVLVFVSGLPFPCPPAPYEAALLADRILRDRGVRGEVEVAVTSPEPRPLPVVPETCSAELVSLLGKRDVEMEYGRVPERVDADGAVTYEDGGTREPDAVAGVPPYRAPDVVAGSPLAGPEGWIPVDPHTFETEHPGVWAVGDVAAVETPSGTPLPKAGVFAEAAAVAVARSICRQRGADVEARPFPGEGRCYLEVGGGEAAAVAGDFYAEPEPEVALEAPSAEALEAKRAFVDERLEAWFGG